MHYEEQFRATLPSLSENEIRIKAKENLARIRDVYDIKDWLSTAQREFGTSKVKAMCLTP